MNVFMHLPTSSAQGLAFRHLLLTVRQETLVNCIETKDGCSIDYAAELMSGTLLVGLFTSSPVSASSAIMATRQANLAIESPLGFSAVQPTFLRPANVW